jgi:antitoxin ParD1/3/4
MSAALTKYWEEFIDELVKSGRYNNRSEVIRAGLRALEELERAREGMIKKAKSKRQ